MLIEVSRMIVEESRLWCQEDSVMMRLVPITPVFTLVLNDIMTYYGKSVIMADMSAPLTNDVSVTIPCHSHDVNVVM